MCTQLRDVTLARSSDLMDRVCVFAQATAAIVYAIQPLTALRDQLRDHALLIP